MPITKMLGIPLFVLAQCCNRMLITFRDHDMLESSLSEAERQTTAAGE